MAVNLNDILGFIVSVIIIKGILVHWLIVQIDKGLKKWFQTTPRKQGIWEHYFDRAKGDGHQTDSIMACHDGKCPELFA